MKPTISIIGTGALGSTLARALHRKRYIIKSLFNRSPSKAKALAGELDVKIQGVMPGSADEVGEILFLAVPDDEICELAINLSKKLDDLSGKSVVHCSGNETSEILEVLNKNDASTAAFHPLQTFNENSNPDSFRNIYISLEGDGEAVKQLVPIADTLHSHILSIDPRAKPYLHAAAVVACNYFITLIDAAGKIAELGGISEHEARRALTPLIQTTLENSTASDLTSVLSGPLARGDVVTIRKHLGILEHNEALLSLYKKLGLQTLELSRRKGSISQTEFNQLKELLSEQ